MAIVKNIYIVGGYYRLFVRPNERCLSTGLLKMSESDINFRGASEVGATSSLTEPDPMI